MHARWSVPFLIVEITREDVARMIVTDLAPRARSKTLDVPTDRSANPACFKSEQGGGNKTQYTASAFV
jgi:hypothetical protein